jgi:hypothetical protein
MTAEIVSRNAIRPSLFGAYFIGSCAEHSRIDGRLAFHLREEKRSYYYRIVILFH